MDNVYLLTLGKGPQAGTWLIAWGVGFRWKYRLIYLYLTVIALGLIALWSMRG